MKRLVLLSLLVMSTVNIFAQDDDMYFSGKLDGVVEDVQTANTASATSRRVKSPSYDSAKLAVYNSNARDDDEYNRRYSFSSSYQTEGGADYSMDYESNDTVFNSDSLSYADEDYYYSRRLLRFHSPRAAVALSSPYYWDLVYGYGVYDYLWDAYYDPFFYTWGWGYGWSWGPWSCWYGSFWGWHHPYAWNYWGWGPGWHGHWGWNHGRYFNRGGHFANRDGGRIHTNALPNGGNASLSRGTFGTRNNGIASRSTMGSTGRDRVVPSRNRTGISANNNRALSSRSSYSDYANARTNNSVGNRSTQSPQGRSVYSRQSSTRNTTYSPNSSARSTYTPSRSTSTSTSRSTYTPSRSTSTGSYSAPSRSSGSFGGGSRGGGFSGGGSRGGGFGGGGSRGGGGRR